MNKFYFLFFLSSNFATGEQYNEPYVSFHSVLGPFHFSLG